MVVGGARSEGVGGRIAHVGPSAETRDASAAGAGLRDVAGPRQPRLDSRREALPDGSQHHNDAPDRGTSRGSCTRGPRDLARKARSEQFDPA